ncbi:MAG: molybdopterin converting factor subunit 1 [Rubrobacter sp.]|nr:molybdopterin converting factor subunit 1 [Rubrobacter sp.]
MSTVRVLLFGAAADRAGVRQTELSPPAAGASLEEFWAVLAERYPGLAPMRDTLAFAVNGEYARLDATVSPGDEVAVLPPVSGG